MKKFDLVILKHGYDLVNKYEIGLMVKYSAHNVFTKIGLMFPQNIGGHDLEGICRNGYGYYVPENHCHVYKNLSNEYGKTIVKPSNKYPPIVCQYCQKQLKAAFNKGYY